MLKRFVLMICADLTHRIAELFCGLSSLTETLYIKSDKELYETLMNADEESDFVTYEELEW